MGERIKCAPSERSCRTGGGGRKGVTGATAHELAFSAATAGAMQPLAAQWRVQYALAVAVADSLLVRALIRQLLGSLLAAAVRGSSFGLLVCSQSVRPFH